MRIIAILLNVLWLVSFIGFIVDEGMPVDSFERIIALLMLITPIINIFVILRKRSEWLTLYLKRRALEEQKKIEDLEK